jgi:GT2 family glycosyltransferase
MQAESEAPPNPSAPVVSVLMTTWNGAAFIAASVRSVLAQSYGDFELIVVDDASTDATPAVLAGFTDPRLRVLRLQANRGVVGARNAGFQLVRGRYVAMLDHDDVSRPERLARQVACLDRHPDIVLVATEVELDTAGRRQRPDHTMGGDTLLLRWLLHVDNPLTWSSVMLRAEAVRRLGCFVCESFALADDFDLYHRLLTIGEIARLEEPLTIYRWHAANTSHAHGPALEAAAIKVLSRAYRPLLGPDSDTAAVLVNRHLSTRAPARDAATLDVIGSILERLLRVGCGAAHAAARRNGSDLVARGARRGARRGTRVVAPVPDPTRSGGGLSSIRLRLVADGACGGDTGGLRTAGRKKIDRRSTPVNLHRSRRFAAAVRTPSVTSGRGRPQFSDRQPGKPVTRS